MTQPEPIRLQEEFELVSERVCLRLYDPKLSSVTSDYYQRNRAHFAPYCPLREPEYHGPEAWRARSLQLRDISLSGQALHLLLFRRGQASTEVIGNVNFTNIVRGVFQAANLGYQLDRGHVGHGLMQEALVVAIAHAFGNMSLHRLMANYVPTNDRSARLLRRLGFQVEGYARDYLFLEGMWKDHLLTSLINPSLAAGA